jgi:rod shape-determining protein MreC
LGVRRIRDNEFSLFLPFRATGQRITLLILIFFSTALFVVGKTNNTLSEQARSSLADVAVPVLDVLSQPILALDWAAKRFVDMVFVYRENDELRETNRRLMDWQAKALKLEQENERFQELLNVKNDYGTVFITPRVVADASGPFVHAKLLNVGMSDGVRKGQVATDDFGVVGQIVAVGQRSARLLLLTDLNSRVPVLVGAKQHPAILAGDNTRFPSISFLPVGVQVSPGDLVLTSGAGGVFPPRLPIGRVVTSRDDVVRVQLFSDSDRLDFVNIMNFRPLPRLEDPTPASESKK